MSLSGRKFVETYHLQPRADLVCRTVALDSHPEFLCSCGYPVGIRIFGNPAGNIIVPDNPMMYGIFYISRSIPVDRQIIWKNTNYQ